MNLIINWGEKLDIFMSDFEHINDVIGILVCGSYVTGNPSNHSDLDVHILLDNNVEYRERGNRIIDGLLIEYFANPPKQIIKYFTDDLKDKSLMSQTQFATGKILLDKNGEVKALKEKSIQMIDDYYKNDNAAMSESTKYFLWDMLDDLQDAYENNKTDFDFLYFNLLDKMIFNYMNCINRPYSFKSILGNITDNIVRKKYLLRELPDTAISDLIAKSVQAVNKKDKMELYQSLAHEILDKFGGFDVDKYKLKSDLDT